MCGDWGVWVCVYTFLNSLPNYPYAKSSTNQYGETRPSCPRPTGPRAPLGDIYVRPSSLHILLPTQQCQSVSCPRAGGSHSRSKEILCKSTGSQRRQDSGQAWQGVCVNSSEQVDFAQRGWSQQSAFPGRQVRAVHLRSLASGRPSRTWCTWLKADKAKS